MLYIPLDEDFQAEGRECVKKGNKTEEEIRKYMTEEDLGESRRTILLLTKGDSLQRRAIIQSLAKTCREHSQIVPNVVSIIREIIPTLDSQLLCSLIWQIMALVPLLDNEVLKEVAQLTLVSLEEWKNQAVSLAWLQLFSLIVADSILFEIQQDTIKVITRLSGAKEILPLRMVSARAIGHLAQSLKNKLKGTLLDRVRTFCRDPDPEMRCIILKEVMPKLFRNLGLELVNIYFIERVFQMVYDSEKDVRIAAIELFLSFYQILSPEDKDRLSRILIQHMQQPEYFQSMSLKAGEIYTKIRFQLERKSNMAAFIACCRSHLSSDDPIVRHNALFNFAGILRHMGLKFWSEVKGAYMETLKGDQVVVVRNMAITILHEVIQVMDSDFDNFPRVVSQISNSLVSTEESTIYCFLSRLPVLFQALRKWVTDLEARELDTSSTLRIIKSVESDVMGLVRHLTNQGAKSCPNYYLISTLHHSIGSSVQQISLGTLLDQYLPLLTDGMLNPNGITLEALLCSFSQLMYQVANKTDVALILSRLDSLLGASSPKKIVYLKLARKLLTYFSKQKYNELGLFSNCARYLSDQVLQVRMELVLYLQSAVDYFGQAEDLLNTLFQCPQIQEFMPRRTMSKSQDNQETRQRRNFQCLRNEETYCNIVSKKKLEVGESKKKIQISNKCVLPALKKPLLKHPRVSKNLTLSTVSSYSMVIPSIPSNRSEVRIKGNQQSRDLPKNIRNIILNKIPETADKQVGKRKFQSVEVSLGKVKPSETTTKRRKTIFQIRTEVP